MAHRPVGAGSSVAFTSGTATTSTSFSIQSSVLRVSAAGGAAHIAVGGTPSATRSDYYIPSGGVETLALTKASNRVIGITTGTTTVVIVPEGTQVPFGVGDYITISGSTYHDFTHQRVASVNTTAGVDGYYQTRMTVDYNSSGILTAFADPDVTVVASNKVSVFGVGAGTLYYQQVQISGQA